MGNHLFHHGTGMGGTHCDGESSQVLSSHLDYLSKREYGAVAIDLITAIVVTALEVVPRCFIINVTPKQSIRMHQYMTSKYYPSFEHSLSALANSWKFNRVLYEYSETGSIDLWSSMPEVHRNQYNYTEIHHYHVSCLMAYVTVVSSISVGHHPLISQRPSGVQLPVMIPFPA